ncbi:hypothetical protein K2Q08_03235 [Patescibacteria group bacterium]|nr:hypothetical protein [Patescibacteria group bacterium]
MGLLLGAIAPLSAFAQSTAAPKIRLTNPSSGLTLGSLVNMFVSFLNMLTAFFLTVAIAAFFWGLIMYIYHAGDVKGRKKGRDTIVWGLIGLFVIVSLAGILQILKGFLPL